MTDGIRENLEATFNNCKSLIEKTANEFVLVERMKKRNQQSCCFAELALRSLVVCVLKEDLSYQLTKMTRTQTSHSTYTHTRTQLPSV